jgi:hypothetical protein
VPGCGCDDDDYGWWVPMTPEHLYLHNDLVHIAIAGYERSYCGRLVWGHIDPPESTDHANHIVAYRKKRYTMATCLECIAGSWTYVGRDLD